MRRPQQVPRDTAAQTLLTAKGLFLEQIQGAKKAVRPYLPQPERKLDKHEVSFPVNDWYSNMTQEVLDWIENMQNERVEVTIRQTRFRTGKRPFVINNVLIGKVEATPEQSYYLEREAAQEILFAAETLRMRIRPKLNIFNTALLDESTSWGALSDKLQHFIGTKASYNNGTVLMNESARKYIDSHDSQDENPMKVTTHNVVSTPARGGRIHHETAHYVDSYCRTATHVQAEAFARSMENGFIFDTAVERLRTSAYYGREITPERIQYIFSREPKGLTATEIYGVSSTFFCWLYEKLGPEAFGAFYGRLTGGHFALWGEGLDRLKRELQLRKPREHFAGNVINCLNSIPRDHRWTWESPQELLEEYVRDVNKDLRPKTKEQISTVV